MRSTWVGLLVVAAALIVGCGGGGNSGTAPSPGGLPMSNGAQVGTDSGAQSGLVPAVGGPVTWHLVVGAERASDALQGLGFYPAQITIDVGDTISWTSASDEPHTVTFLAPGGSLPPPNSPSAALPAGGTTEDGSTFTSSGFIFKNQSYSLTFTKAGAYTFYCIIHQPEMVGAVIVHSAGSAYPKSQPVLTALGTGAASRDLAAAQVSITRFPYEIRGTHLTAGVAPGLSAVRRRAQRSCASSMVPR